MAKWHSMIGGLVLVAAATSATPALADSGGTPPLNFSISAPQPAGRSAYVAQIGDANRVTVEQSAPDALADIRQHGGNDTATVRQHGSGSDFALIRQTGNPAATNYLAVAWYDEKGKLLPSNQPRPAGAGAPVGWSNGTYSYYGLVNRPASATWTHYTITFGVGETAAIPSNAAFLRAGVLLNYHAAPGAIMQLKEVDVSEKSPYRHLLFVAPAFSTLHTPASQAARMSEHWPAQQAIMAQAGTEELRARVRTFAHRPSD